MGAMGAVKNVPLAETNLVLGVTVTLHSCALPYRLWTPQQPSNHGGPANMAYYWSLFVPLLRAGQTAFNMVPFAAGRCNHGLDVVRGIL